MHTLAHSSYLDSEFDVPLDLPQAGSPLENPFVFDASARELKQMAQQGPVEILSERLASDGDALLINRLRFKRFL